MSLVGSMPPTPGSPTSIGAPRVEGADTNIMASWVSPFTRKPSHAVVVDDQPGSNVEKRPFWRSSARLN